MTGSTMSRSAHGLGTSRAATWQDAAVCAGTDPRWFDTAPGGLSMHNEQALAMCRRCPVREKCRDAAREGHPTSLIAGGWVWDSTGHVTPCAGDEHLRPARAVTAPKPQSGRGGWRRGKPLDVENYLAAAEDLWVHGHSVAVVAERYGLAKTTAYTAQMIRRDVPELIPKIREGSITVNRALREARLVAAARRRSGGTPPARSGCAAVQEEVKTG